MTSHLSRLTEPPGVITDLGRERSIQYRWPLAPAPEERYGRQGGETGTITAELWCYHTTGSFGSSPGFRASVSQLVAFPHGGYRRTYDLRGAPVWSMVEPVPRYSRKRLEAFAEAALAALRAAGAHQRPHAAVMAAFEVP